MRRVKHIRISNILGISELEIEPGRITRVEGGNATGKTSVLEAIKAALSGGHDATLIRNGAEEGEVVLVLDDETEVVKRIAGSGSDLKVSHPDFGRISAGQTFLNGIADQLTLNPVEFLTAGSGDRAELLLEAMPLTIEEEKLKEAVGDLLRSPAPLEGEHALTTIDRVHKALYDERTGVNRVAKEKRKAAGELRKSLPADGADPDELRSRITQLETEHRQGEVRLGQQIAEVETAKEKAVAALQEERDRKIREIEQEYQARIDAEKEKASTHRENLQLEVRPELNRKGEEISALKERLRSADQHENTRRLLDEAEATAEEHEAESQALSDALERLDTLRLGLLDELPIEGVEIRDGEVHVDGVPFPRVNHAEQIRIAAEVVKLRAGDLALVPVDGLEALEEEHLEALLEGLADAGLQPIVTRVTEGPLSVQTVGA